MLLYSIKNNLLISILINHTLYYPTGLNRNYFYAFGSLRGLVLVIQILRGVFLAIHYVPNIFLAFVSVEHIIRDVNSGWLIRYTHANGASLFFIVVYAHIFRGLYYSSFIKPRQILWKRGVLLLILIIITGFIGYVLPWGQISLWGATVITNLVSAVPIIGHSVVFWLWGGFSVSNATLNRFFRLHYLFPFLLVALSGLHLTLLHLNGSSNPLRSTTSGENIQFYPYFYVKDLLVFLVISLFLCILLFFLPNLLGHPDNYIPASILVTPTHIVPEWYFLSFYAILRRVPHKLGGVVIMGLALVCLILLPYINTIELRSCTFRPISQLFFWFFVNNLLLLGCIGQKVVETPFVEIGQFATVFYFTFLFIFIPFFTFLESRLMRTIYY